MNSRLFLLPVFILIAFASLAQSEDPTRKASYFFSVHTGGLLGGQSQGSSFTAVLKQGVRWNKGTLGAGIGYDAFAEWRTVPISLMGRVDFISTRANKFYLETAFGYARARVSNTSERHLIEGERGGMFFHPQVGYRIHADKLNVYLSVGYKLQRVKYEYTDTWWGWRQSSSRHMITRDMERLSIQIGVGL